MTPILKEPRRWSYMSIVSHRGASLSLRPLILTDHLLAACTLPLTRQMRPSHAAALPLGGTQATSRVAVSCWTQTRGRSALFTRKEETHGFPLVLAGSGGFGLAADPARWRRSCDAAHALEQPAPVAGGARRAPAGMGRGVGLHVDGGRDNGHAARATALRSPVFCPASLAAERSVWAGPGGLASGGASGFVDGGRSAGGAARAARRQGVSGAAVRAVRLDWAVV